EDFARFLLPDHLGQIGRTVSAVKARNIGIGLLEYRVFPAGEGKIAHHMERMPAAHGPSRDHGNHDLWHEPYEPLDLEDVEPVHSVVAHITLMAARTLVAAAAKRVNAVFWRWPLGRKQ